MYDKLIKYMSLFIIPFFAHRVNAKWRKREKSFGEKEKKVFKYPMYKKREAKRLPYKRTTNNHSYLFIVIKIISVKKLCHFYFKAHTNLLEGIQLNMCRISSHKIIKR